MARFYFTYGLEEQPFVGGWTVVEAPDWDAACELFRSRHPDRIDGLLNCAGIYDEKRFQRTVMYKNGNLGFRCHEYITTRHKADRD